MVSKLRIMVGNINAVDKDVWLVFCLLSPTPTWRQQRKWSHMSLTFLPSFVLVAFFVFFPFVIFFLLYFITKGRSEAAKYKQVSLKYELRKWQEVFRLSSQLSTFLFCVSIVAIE